ncbi:hypothetical protein COEX109129_40340 [Corallococcus exiguus]
MKRALRLCLSLCFVAFGSVQAHEGLSPGQGDLTTSVAATGVCGAQGEASSSEELLACRPCTLCQPRLDQCLAACVGRPPAEACEVNCESEFDICQTCCW